MNQDIEELLDELNRAINDALESSDEILNLLTALEEAIGDFRISIDLLLPGAEDQNDPPHPRLTDEDQQFLRALKIKH